MGIGNAVRPAPPGFPNHPARSTIDVEDYFHPNAMDAVVDRVDAWDGAAAAGRAQHAPPPRPARASTACSATFFVLGWVAERLAAPRRRDRAPRPRGRLSRLRPSARLPPRSGALSRRRRRAPSASSRTASAPARRGLPRRQLLDRRIDAVGARRPHRAGIRVRLQHLSGPPRHLRHSPGSSRFAVRLRRAAGEIIEIPRVDRAPARAQLAGRRRRLLSPASLLA